MTEERLKLHEKAEVKINAIIDTLSQDKGGLADRLKQEDVKDFLISLLVDCSAEKDKQIEELKNNNKVYCIGEGETLVVNTTFDKFTRINANKKIYYPHDMQLKELEEKDKQIAELREQLEINEKCCIECGKDWGNQKVQKRVVQLEAQIENMINKIDKTMVLSNMRECEICDIQDIFRKYGFKRNEGKWEIKEND